MTRQMLDEYLDGALSTEQAADITALLESDVNAAELCARIKRERALRAAAIAGYAPSTTESADAASRMLAMLHDEASAPIARIGMPTWFKRSLGIAAMLAIMAGGFYAGRVTAPETVNIVKEKEIQVDPGKTVYTVVYSGASGNQLTKEFDNATDSQEFVAQLQHSTSTIASTDVRIDDHGMW